MTIGERSKMTLILNNAQITDLISMQDCVDILEDAFIELAEGRGACRCCSDICTPSTHPSGGMYAHKSMDGIVPKLGVGAIRLNCDILTFHRAGRADRRFPGSLAGKALYARCSSSAASSSGMSSITSCPHGTSSRHQRRFTAKS
jgi:hypothetical protein